MRKPQAVSLGAFTAGQGAAGILFPHFLRRYRLLSVWVMRVAPVANMTLSVRDGSGGVICSEGHDGNVPDLGLGIGWVAGRGSDPRASAGTGPQTLPSWLWIDENWTVTLNCGDAISNLVIVVEVDDEND